MQKEYGTFYSYTNTSRALIFARDEPQVATMEDLQHLMRYNDYKNDPLSLCDGCDPPYSAYLAISCISCFCVCSNLPKLVGSSTLRMELFLLQLWGTRPSELPMLNLPTVHW